MEIIRSSIDLAALATRPCIEPASRIPAATARKHTGIRKVLATPSAFGDSSSGHINSESAGRAITLVQHALSIRGPASAFRWQAKVRKHLQAALPCPHAGHDRLQVITEATNGLDTGKEKA
jgi:hypothetical protein